MKTNSKIILLFMVFALVAISSCTKESLDPLYYCLENPEDCDNNEFE